MKKHLIICLAIFPASEALPQAGDGQETLSELTDRRSALLKEERSLAQQIAMFEEQSKAQVEQLALLKERLDFLNATPGTLPQDPDASPASKAGDPSDDAASGQRQNELISGCVDRMVILEAKGGRISTAFLGPQEGKARIFASAPWVAEVGNFSVTALNGSAVPIAQGLSCPVGAELLGLHPETQDLPHFDLAPENGFPAVGARILVVLVDAKSKRLSGVGGTIRGIGPDALELDAELTPEMGGAPVLDMATGKVIGIVAHQIAGVADDWAVGTRHEGSRNFALRLDRIKEWETSDLGRFAKEATYIKGINRRSQLAWTAHTLMDSELEHTRGRPSSSPSTHSTYRQRLREWQEKQAKIEKVKAVATDYADKHPSDLQIKKARSWAAEIKEARYMRPGGELELKRTGIYQLILADLKKKEPDLSAHLSTYHKNQYQAAMKNRLHLIEMASGKTSRIGQ